MVTLSASMNCSPKTYLNAARLNPSPMWRSGWPLRATRSPSLPARS